MALYSKVARGWSCIFFIVGLLFWFEAHRTEQFLTILAHDFGLSGNIEAPANNLWQVLAISLMATITVCAWQSATNPLQLGFYYGLLVAKGVSTVLFLALAGWISPAWLICAGGDAFVALTLWWSYRVSFRKMWNDRKAWVATHLPSLACRKYAGLGPFYEVWFGEIQIAPQTALWFHYEIIDFAHCRTARAFAVLFEPAGILADTADFALEELAPPNCLIVPSQETDRFRQTPQLFCVGPLRLDTANALGKMDKLAWDLSFHNVSKRCFTHVPKILQLSGLTKSVLASSHLDIRFDGTVRKGTETMALAGVPGMIGHIYGTKRAYAWAWIHANAFEDNPQVVVEGISARLKLGGLLTPPLSSFVLYTPAGQYSFCSTWKLLAAKSVWGDGKWAFATTGHKVGTGQRVSLEGEAIAPQARHIAVVTYQDADGKPIWCSSSKLGSLQLRFSDETGQEFIWNAKETAAFELAGHQEPAVGVKL